MKTAAAYIRVSTDAQTEASPDSQRAEILKYAEANGITVLEKYIFIEGERQRGLSGRKAANRPKFLEMIATAKATPRPFDCILVWKFSRFARNIDEATYYKSILRNKCGVDVISVSEPISEGMYGRLIEMIIEWSDEFYSLNLASEVIRGMTARAQAGGFCSHAPIGYKMVEKRLVRDPKTADAVRDIFEAYARGERVSDIAAEINARGIRTLYGNALNSRFINYVIDNPVYKGDIVFSAGGKRGASDGGALIEERGAHEPLVSRELWERCRTRRDGERRTVRRESRKNDYALRSLLRCGACGSVLSYSSNGRLQCSAYNRGVCRVSHSISCAAAEKAVKERVMMDIFDVSFNAEKRKSEGDTSFSTVAQLQRRLMRLDDAYTAGIYSLEEYSRARGEITNAIESERRRAEIAPPSPERASLPSLYEGLTPSAKNQVLTAIIDRVTVHKSNEGYELEIDYKSFLDFHEIHDGAHESSHEELPLRAAGRS